MTLKRSLIAKPTKMEISHYTLVRLKELFTCLILFFLHFGLTPYRGCEACVSQGPNELCRLGPLSLARLTVPDWSKGITETENSIANWCVLLWSSRGTGCQRPVAEAACEAKNDA